MRRIILGIFIWFSFVSLSVAQAAPEAEVTSEETQQLQEQITALQKKLDSLLKRTEDSRPGEMAETQTSGSGTESSPGAEQIQQVPGREGELV